MCYKVATPTLEDLTEYLKDAPGYVYADYEPYFFADGFGFPRLPVQLQGQPNRIASLRWGLIPFWFDLQKERKKSIEAQIRKIEKAGKKFELDMVHPLPDEKLIKAFQAFTLNAKAEEVFNLPSWKPSIMKKRCIIYTRGFYEWRHYDNGKVKVPYYIYPRSEQVLRMGGIWSEWTNQETGEVFETCAILTVPANTLLSKIHNSKLRMPLLFSKEESDQWLYNDTTKEEVTNLMKPCNDAILTAHTVTSEISNPKIAIEQKNTAEIQNEVLYLDWVKD